MKRLSLDRKISHLSLKPPSSTLTTFHPIMMKLPAREGKLLGLVRDKIPSCLFSRVSRIKGNWIGAEIDSIRKIYIYHMVCLCFRHETYFLSSVKN